MTHTSTDLQAARALTFHVHHAHHLRIAVSVPHLAHVCARVAGLGSLDQQARHALSEACVGLQWPVVL